MAFPGEVIERRKKGAFPGEVLEGGGAFPGEVVEQRKNPNADLLGEDAMAGLEETGKGLKEAPAAFVRGVVEFFENTLNMPADIANAVGQKVSENPAALEFLSKNPAIPSGQRTQAEGAGTAFTPVPTLDLPKPDAPETMFGQAIEVGGEIAGGFIPVGAALRAPGKAVRAARGIGTARQAATEAAPAIAEAVSTKAPGVVDDAARPVFQASADVEKAAALTPEQVLAQRELPKKVEGFSSKVLSADDELAQVRANILEAGEGFRGARRSPMTIQEIKQGARNLGMTEDEFLAREVGQAYNAEQITRAEEIAQNAALQLKEIATQAHQGKASQEAFENALRRTGAVLEQAAGARSEGGRALRAMREAGAPSRQLKRAIDNILQGKVGDPSLLNDKAALIASLDDPAQVARFARMSAPATTWDKVMEGWINGLLSGLQTHVVNAASNGLMSVYSLPERALGATFGLASKGERIYFREVAAQASGMVKAMGDATKAAAKAFAKESSPDLFTKLELPKQQVIRGLKGKIIRIPGRALESADVWFKTINYGGELEALATRQAIKEGLSGERLAARVAELRANPPKDLHNAAWSKAESATFTTPLAKQEGIIAGGAKAINSLAANHPSARIIFPFIRTPTNIFKASVARSPLGVFMKDVQKEIAAGGARRQMALAQVVLGTSAATYAGALAAEGRLTGGGPSDPSERARLRETGWQPYSIKIGDTYYSYARFEPLGTLLGVAADTAQVLQAYEQGKGADDLAALVSGAFAKNIKEKTFLQGMSSLVEAMDDPDRFGERFIQNLAGSAIPTGLAQGARVVDPVVRDVQGIVDRLKTRIPGLSQDVAPRLNLWGEPIVRGGTGSIAADLLNPVYISKDKNDPVADEIVRLEISPRMPRRQIDGTELTAAQYNRYVQLAGVPAKEYLRQFISAPEWKDWPDGLKTELIEKTITEFRARAREQMLLDNPDLLEASQARKMERLQ